MKTWVCSRLHDFHIGPVSFVRRRTGKTYEHAAFLYVFGKLVFHHRWF